MTSYKGTAETRSLIKYPGQSDNKDDSDFWARGVQDAMGRPRTGSTVVPELRRLKQEKPAFRSSLD